MAQKWIFYDGGSNNKNETSKCLRKQKHFEIEYYFSVHIRECGSTLYLGLVQNGHDYNLKLPDIYVGIVGWIYRTKD